MTNYFTGKGDDGTTGMLGEGRTSKSDVVMEVLGSLDELNSVTGIARNQTKVQRTRQTLLKVQKHLYSLMGEVAATLENQERFRSIGNEQIEWLELEIKTLESEIGTIHDFIIPGDSLAGAYLDLGRTVCRRAERRLVELFEVGKVTNSYLLGYINRLSSLFFVLELVENRSSGVELPTLAKGS